LVFLAGDIFRNTRSAFIPLLDEAIFFAFIPVFNALIYFFVAGERKPCIIACCAVVACEGTIHSAGNAMLSN
jgi:hypothetical protein